MKHIKLSNGKVLDVYGIYTYSENNKLAIEILNSSLGEVESLFTEENLSSITVLNGEEIDTIYNGYIEVVTMSKEKEDIPKSYLGIEGSGDESVTICKVVLKATGDLSKKIDSLVKQNESLQKSQ